MASTAPAKRRPPTVQPPSLVLPRPAAAIRLRRLTLPHLGDGAYLFWAAATLYLMLGIQLVLQMHLIVGDAWSRVGNAYYVLFSRDPHLAAIGFVWNPLPSLLEMPLVLLHAIWPPLVQQGFAASVISIAAMAGAVYVLHAILVDWGVPRIARVALVAVFAVHPMVLHYGANGDTEALYLLLMLLAVRHLSRWLETSRLDSLVFAAVAIALGYWTRYETVAVAVAVVALVAFVTYRRFTGSRRERILAGVADGIIVGAPFAVAFVTWAIASWVIVGNPFEQFSSVYGTASQLETGSVFNGTAADRFNMAIAVLRGFEPALVIIGPVTLVGAILRRDPRWFAAIAIMGSILSFALVAWVAGKTGGWIRYYITIIPVTVLLAGLLIAWFRQGELSGRIRPPLVWLRAGLVAGVMAAVVGGTAVALPTSWDTMRDSYLGRGEWNKLADLPQYVMGAEVSSYVDSLHLGDGQLLVDVFLGFPIVLESDYPRQFVETTDRDFKAVLTDPQTFGVRYILVPPTAGLGSLDAIIRQWPGIYSNGAGIGTLVKEFDVPGTSGLFQWRLYAVDS
jgi:hypothetical protein